MICVFNRSPKFYQFIARILLFFLAGYVCICNTMYDICIYVYITCRRLHTLHIYIYIVCNMMHYIYMYIYIYSLSISNPDFYLGLPQKPQEWFCQWFQATKLGEDPCRQDLALSQEEPLGRGKKWEVYL